ncbi:hypothetical protein [Campylobacter corcagiensis]|uniref:Uncharacterized protein n=1 Tax=Campylobacter corcagiensis TaxID=1448857 RepID=A0A7M1LJT8_9BACT|nr:hypothetical protein [Campylobacter corcagiensis]QKF64002.1 putative membrane protein [Campylobacter corcagiensis]QOQ87795.1 hypothetical protein IMC76_03015 [Campylobacter corcagiensis]
MEFRCQNCGSGISKIKKPLICPNCKTKYIRKKSAWALLVSRIMEFLIVVLAIYSSVKVGYFFMTNYALGDIAYVVVSIVLFVMFMVVFLFLYSIFEANLLVKFVKESDDGIH